MKLYDSAGNAVVLGDRIAQGGEGAVYRIPANPTLVAKIYHKHPTPDRIAKLRTMAQISSPELTKLACWPIDLLLDPTRSTVHGFTMPNAVGFKEVHKLYSPKSRTGEFQ
ncbi:MAG: hypothetical protein EOP84_27230, partial [Verrucomicrobiaceae bacterium]